MVIKTGYSASSTNHRVSTGIVIPQTRFYLSPLDIKCEIAGWILDTIQTLYIVHHIISKESKGRTYFVTEKIKRKKTGKEVERLFESYSRGNFLVV